MDLPLLFHLNKLTIEQVTIDTNPKSTTYVDDTTTTIQLNKEIGYQQQIDNTVTTLNDYMNSNLLTMNDTKTELFIILKKYQHPRITTNQQHNKNHQTHQHHQIVRN